MGARSYLSIGEVLDLLKAEFPDITISKIRFLESQGLLEPERTASGYRKFYEADIDRLRFILQQQREKYLPLKVIRGQLVGGSSDVSAGDETIEIDGGVLVTSPGSMVAADGELVDAVSLAESEARHPTGYARVAVKTSAAARLPSLSPARTSTPMVPNGDRSNVPPIAFAQAVVAESPRDHEEFEAVEETATPSTPSTPSGPAGTGSSGPSGPPPSSITSAFEALRQTATSTDGTGTDGTGTDVRVQDGHAPQGPRGDRNDTDERVSRPEDFWASPVTDRGSSSGIAMGIEELSGATGLSIESIRQLEQFGLLVGHGVFSSRYYDEEALLVAKLAAGFLKHGVEPRHLRMYKTAAEREAGFFEQVVTPQLKRRSPEARSDALATLADLARLGERFRAITLRQVLRSAVDTPPSRPHS